MTLAFNSVHVRWTAPACFGARRRGFIQPPDPMDDKPRPGLSCASTLAATVLVLGLSGCAAVGPQPGRSASEASPYVGVFTGEFVDGKPLYRFPAIHVVGARSGAGPEN